MVEKSATLSYITMFIPFICSGGLLVGVVFFISLYIRTKDRLHFAMTLLGIGGLTLVFSEALVLYIGSVLYLDALSRQIFRIEQLAAMSFLVSLPFFIHYFFKFTGIYSKINRLVLVFNLVACGIITLVAFFAPDLFVSITTPMRTWRTSPGNYGRGITGPLYTIRDILLALLFLYVLFISVFFSLRKKHRMSGSTFFLLGLVFVIFQTLDDIAPGYKGIHIGPFGNIIYSRFSVGMTVFITISMIVLIWHYVSNAMKTDYFYSMAKESQDSLRFIAYHDEFTQLGNRRSFIEYLEHKTQETTIPPFSNAQLWTVALIECSGYKSISDHLGRETGDLVIQEIVERLQRIIQHQGILFRTDSYEFSIVLPAQKNEYDSTLIIEKILAELKHPYIFPGHALYITPRAGISLFPKDAACAQDLVRCAELALAEAISIDVPYHFNTSAIKKNALERMDFIHEIRKAIDQKEFILFFQPQVHTSLGVVGAEALIRWIHPTKGLIEPTRFISITEETGLIIPLGRWIISEACALSQQAKQKGINLPISINLSAQQLRDVELIPFITGEFKKHQIGPGEIHIEMTESCLMQDINRNLVIIQKIRDLGCAFAIDDFGTGYSSLGYLKELPVNIVKIDRSFIKGLPSKKQDAAIVKSIINMCTGLGFSMIAEGAETKEQCQFLAENFCPVVQGYFYSAPLPFEDYLQFVKKYNEENLKRLIDRTRA